MPMKFDRFPDSLIDDISVDPDNNYMTPIWNTICSQHSFRNVLDVGCGNGLFTISLKKKYGCLLNGIDGSDYAVESAKRLGFDDVQLINDFCRDTIPYNNSQFDFVFCKDVFEHLLDPVFLTNEIHRVLRLKGLLLLHIPNHFTLVGRIRFLFRNNIDTYNYFPTATRWNFPHIRFFTYESIIRLLERCHFQVIRNYSDYFVSFPFQNLPLMGKVGKLFAKWNPDQFSEGYTVLAQTTP